MKRRRLYCSFIFVYSIDRVEIVFYILKVSLLAVHVWYPLKMKTQDAYIFTFTKHSYMTDLLLQQNHFSLDQICTVVEYAVPLIRCLDLWYYHKKYEWLYLIALLTPSQVFLKDHKQRAVLQREGPAC